MSPVSLEPDGLQANDLPTSLGRGERAAIVLAAYLRPGIVLLDDRAAVAMARARGLAVTGTLGVLYRAARLGMVDLEAAFDQLKVTSFHHTPALLERLIARFRGGGSVP